MHILFWDYISKKDRWDNYGIATQAGLSLIDNSHLSMLAIFVKRASEIFWFPFSILDITDWVVASFLASWPWVNPAFSRNFAMLSSTSTKRDVSS